MAVYWKVAKSTKSAFHDGRLNTGDIGKLEEDGFLYITGRIKNLIIPENDESNSLEGLEGKLHQIKGDKKLSFMPTKAY